jgi:predicted transcriptional regulator
MVAYYENQSPSPAVDVAQKCAEILGVPLAALVDENREPKRVRPGPRSQLDERVEKIKQLPRRQQDLVIALLDAFLDQNAKRA